jgi:hypothetical protein
MKAKKMIATLVVLLMVLSTLVVLDQLNINLIQKASASTPGVDEWGYHNQIWTKGLKYNPNTAVDIIINTNGLLASPINYYLYYPVYHRSGVTYNLTWRPYLISGVQQYITVSTPGTNVTLSGITLNRTGVWVLNTTQQVARINGNDWAHTAPRWFWVNTSQDYSLSVSPTQVFYGKNQTIDLTVTGASGSVWFDVRRALNNKDIALHKSANYSFSSDWKSKLMWAGNYSAIAYQHVDYNNEPLYDPATGGWNTTFGSLPAIVAGFYDYANNGPWDPPAYNSSHQTLYCQPGELATSIPVGNQTMYWGFQGEVNVTMKDYNNQNLTAYTPLSVLIQGPDVNGNTQNLNSEFNISNQYLKGYVTIESGSWGLDGSTVYGVNGTWNIILYSDRDGDATPNNHPWADEWNTTVTFTVTSAPGMQWKWVKDDGGIGKPNDGVIPYVPDIAQQPLMVEFQILGKSASSHYGDGSADPVADYGGNISLSGDALFLPTTLDMLPGVSFSGGTWTVPLTPKMALNGGQITFAATWKDHGSLTETLTVGGSKLNGTIVTISPTEFTYGENTTFTVTVKTGAGLPAYNAKVWLYWVFGNNGTLVKNGQNGIISYKNGGGTANGEYTFLVNTTMQKKNQTDAYGDIMAPRNISAYVELYEGSPVTDIWGYALTKMKAQSNLKTTMEPSLVLAGQKINKFWINTTIVNSAGNKTGRPDNTGLHVRIYNSTGDDVTDALGNIASTDLDGSRYINLTNKFLQAPGTYTVFAYNATCNSNGHNGTIVVKPVDVTCDLSELIWNVDDNVTATFTVNYNGLPVNGTLLLDNITSNTSQSHNGTWNLCNNTPDIGTTGLTIYNYTAIQITVINGVGIVHNITADHLWPAKAAQQNVTFRFKSKTAGSAWANTTGFLPVKIAHVAVAPAAVVLNEASDLTVTITGRGTGLRDVFVSIGGATDAQNGSTASDGKITFSVVPTKTGKITIAVENRTSSTYVLVTNWRLYIDPISQINEGASFTVMVRNGSATGAGLAGVQIIAGTQSGTTDASGAATFTAPEVGHNGATLTITATKGGYATAIITTIVNNVPKLIIIPQSGKIYGTKTFTITVANDDGSGVAGATVTFNGANVLSGANGVTELTAPDVKETSANYQITATFTGYTDATPVTITIYKTPGIPGFELLTLVVALGVAFLLLRRRQK